MKGKAEYFFLFQERAKSGNWVPAISKSLQKLCLEFWGINHTAFIVLKLLKRTDEWTRSIIFKNCSDSVSSDAETDAMLKQKQRKLCPLKFSFKLSRKKESETEHK